MMKQISEPETKNMVAYMKNYNFRSKGKKQVNLADPGKVSYSKKKTRRTDSLYEDSDAKKSVEERAEEVLQSIPMEYPRISMTMFPSNVYYSFWLILPLEFCKYYMPNKNVKVCLVDDLGKQWYTKYLRRQHGLSAGWKSFAMDHKLSKGDIVVFHMISPRVFKVNIVRVYDPDMADAARKLMLLSGSLGDC